VPAIRLSNDFVKNQALGIGRSERIRTKSISFFEFLNSCFKEIIKWAGSAVIALKYSVQGKPQVSWMILKFRLWVSKGLFDLK
jgi:hypothetical protein